MPGIDAAVRLLLTDAERPSHVIVLAADLPHIAPLIDALATDALVTAPNAQGCPGGCSFVPVDAAGFPQPLAAKYHFGSLVAALAALPRRRDIAARRLLEDADTPEEARRHHLG